MALLPRHQRAVGWVVIGILAGAVLWRAWPLGREPPLRCAHVMGMAWPGGRAVVCTGRRRLRVSELLLRLSLPPSRLGGGPRWVAPGELASAARDGSVTIGRLSAAEQLALGCALDLNALGPLDLELLPGIGSKLAARVVAHRQRIGRFGSPNELRDVRGIGQTTVQRLAPLLRVSWQGAPQDIGFPCTRE